MSEEEASDAVTALHDLSAADMIAGFRARQFSPSEVLDEVLAHVARWEPHIKALYAFDPDGARAAAKASTERWQSGESSKPLDGVPVTIKENIATKGTPVPLGAATTKLVPAEADAPPAARLLAPIALAVPPAPIALAVLAAPPALGVLGGPLAPVVPVFSAVTVAPDVSSTGAAGWRPRNCA